MTCAITGVVQTPDGNPLLNSRIIFKRLSSTAAIGAVVVVPNSYETVTDGSGNVNIALFPGQYEARAFGDRVHRFIVGVPDEATAIFASLIDQFPPITSTLTQEVAEARNQAVASAATAATAAASAEAVADILQPYTARADFIASDIAPTVTRASFYVNGNSYAVVRDAAGPIVQTNGERWRPDGPTSIVYFGDYSESNNAPALQAAVNYELSLPGGTLGEVHIPAGNWRFTSEVVCDVRGLTGLPNSQRQKAPVLVGAGQGKTTLSGTTANMSVYRVLGDRPLTTASYGYTELVRDLAFTGGGDNPRTVVGLVVEDIAFFTIRNMGGFNLFAPVRLIGGLSGTFENARFRENTYGVIGTAGASHCNAITFLSSNLQVCTQAAIDIRGGCSNLTLIGGSIEGCGTMGNASTGGIYLEGTGSQGEVAISTFGTYFEVNRGGYDVSVNAVSGGSMVQIHSGSMFQRASDTSYVQHNIVTTGKVKTVLTGAAFTKGNTYTADAARPYLNISALGTLIEAGCRFEDAIDAPRIDQSSVFGGFVQGSLGASVTGNLPRGWSVSQVSTGLFRITHNFGDTGYAPIACIISGNARFVERTIRNPSSFDVRVLRTADNVATDDDFSFVVQKFGGPS